MIYIATAILSNGEIRQVEGQFYECTDWAEQMIIVNRSEITIMIRRKED